MSARYGVATLRTLAAAGLCVAFAGAALAQPATIVIAPSAPPPPRVETVPPPPAAVDVWVQGHWAWNGSNWNWEQGRYVARPAPQAAWVPGHWEQHGGGYVWVDGRWAG
ncbi:MAG: BcpO-related WXXGXW repeat protein [Proteobacteria bacterium]|nr:BcpO-related WXXGXW repeat protein [Pseudomonadota bacterium]